MPEHFKTRRQLTLFVHGDNGIIEKIRKEFNPVQQQLIAAHVTLCREDEIEPLEKIIENIKSVSLDRPVKITFGPAARFENQKGVLMPATAANPEFHNVRRKILQGVNNTPRHHHPHITLMHPRNSTCTDDIFQQIKEYDPPAELNFDTISLIEQSNGGLWKILEAFKIFNERAKNNTA